MFIDTTIAFIGSGMMAEAMIRGLLSQKIVEPGQIIAAGPRPERAEKLHERHAIEVTTDNRIAAEKGQIVVLSVKPQVLNDVMPEIRGHLRRQDMVVSIIAGMPIEVIANGLAHAAVVRAMPNTPAQIGQGITVWTVTPEVSESQKQQAQAILIDAGVHMGFSRRISKQLVFQTMRGSVEFAARSDKHVAELRNQVTSPGGTSAEALYHMEKGGLRTVISRGIWAAYQRSITLGKGQKRGSVNGE
jgi:pyrroline-5-carboxylate reductase